MLNITSILYSMYYDILGTSEISVYYERCLRDI